MSSCIKWYFGIVLLAIISLFTSHFLFSPVHLEKLTEIRKKTTPLSTEAFHKRHEVEKILLQNDQNQRVIYHISAPSSRLDFVPHGDRVQILETMEYFKISGGDPTLKRLFQGNEAVYDFKGETLSASNFELSIYNQEDRVFKGVGQNLSFYFQELKPCFSTKNFTAQLKLEKESL